MTQALATRRTEALEAAAKAPRDKGGVCFQARLPSPAIPCRLRFCPASPGCGGMRWINPGQCQGSPPIKNRPSANSGKGVPSGRRLDSCAAFFAQPPISAVRTTAWGGRSGCGAVNCRESTGKQELRRCRTGLCFEQFQDFGDGLCTTNNSIGRRCQ